MLEVPFVADCCGSPSIEHFFFPPPPLFAETLSLSFLGVTKLTLRLPGVKGVTLLRTFYKI